MKPTLAVLSVALGACLAGSGALQAADLAHGKTLHDANCVACHSSMFQNNPAEIYSRPDRRVTSKEGLLRQVRRCENSLGLRWFDDEVQAVTGYLNGAYYKF